MDEDGDGIRLWMMLPAKETESRNVGTGVKG